jgi:Mrp family chromosome partitioning ATPase
MGRMLEALKQGKGQRGNPAPPPIPEEPLRNEIQVAVHSEEPLQEEFPFIEVGGGPGKKFEASATVLATPVPSSMLEKKAPPTPKNLGPMVPTLSQPRPMTVAFEPWPAKVNPCLATEIISFHQPEHPVSKQYDSLFEKVTEGCRVLLFAGDKGAGTTTVLLNLAFSGCMRFQKRLVVVDCNFGRPALAERLGVPPSPGWAEFLAGSVALEKALQATAHPLLSCVAAKEKSEDVPAEVLRWVIGWLRDRCDLVLVDGPLLEQGQHMAAVSGVGDGTYLVLPQNTGPDPNAIQKITRLGIRVRGLIHTQFENV